MSKRGRKALTIPRIRWQVFVREDLAAEVELLISDPMRDKAKYGARTDYLESLIERDLTERRRQYAAEQAQEPVREGQDGGDHRSGQGDIEET